jgi:hypothetical protein
MLFIVVEMILPKSFVFSIHYTKLVMVYFKVSFLHFLVILMKQGVLYYECSSR